MGIVTYPRTEIPDERKAREKAGLPIPMFSFTVLGRDADERDETAAPAAILTMREILKGAKK